MNLKFVKYRRLELGMTQKEVAEKLGKCRSWYTLFESGQRQLPVKLLPKLAKILKCSLENFF